MGMLGAPEIIVIAVIALIIFGPRQLPKMGKAMGETIREWKNVQKEIQKAHDDISEEIKKS